MDLWLGALLYAVVYWDGVPARCLVDTGSNATWVSRTLAGQIGTLSPELARHVGVLNDGRRIDYALHTVPNAGTPQLGLPLAHVIVVPDADMLPGQICVLGTNYLRTAGAVLTFNGPLDGVYGRAILHSILPAPPTVSTSAGPNAGAATSRDPHPRPIAGGCVGLWEVEESRGALVHRQCGRDLRLAVHARRKEPTASAARPSQKT